LEGRKLMGARINYVFKDSEDYPSVVLYSHWGETEWERDIAMALEHSKPRWADTSYATRMMISYLMQDSILGDSTVIIDFTDMTVYGQGSMTKVKWTDFVAAYAPSLVEQI
jgi:hypothetical protein